MVKTFNEIIFITPFLGVCKDGGEVVFGNFDQEKCDRKIEWFKLAPKATEWKIEIDKFEISGKLFVQIK